MKMKSNMTHSFSQIPSVDLQRSSFDRSSTYKTTFDTDYLVPVFVDEALPGDTFNCDMTGFARMATPIFPIMDNMFLETFFFAVPYRLVWDNWQKFNGEQIDPGDSTDYLVPTMTAPDGGYDVGSIYDYLGLPTGVGGYEHSSLPLRAINLIYNEWFRDENLIDSLTVRRTDSGDSVSDFSLQRRAKRRDYFTSSLPWPQKGDAVSLPLGSSANIAFDSSGGPAVYPSVYSSVDGDWKQFIDNYGQHTNSISLEGSYSKDSASLYADLSTATAATVNQLRQAFQVQRMLERDARGGTRYIEIIKSHFGVTSPDARLQRPEYLGGGSTPVNISPVAQTSSSDDNSPQGNLSAFGTSSFTKHGFNKSFTEHCIVIGFVNVRADLTYQQGLDRMWSRQTRYDFYWPALSHLGEQTVLNKEIYTQGTDDDEDVFGYQERYAEYRYKPSKITGLFRSDAALSLDAWHLSQDFTSLPTLSKSFIESNTPLDRCIAVTSQPQFIFDSFINLRCARPMPVYSVPGMIDHF